MPHMSSSHDQKTTTNTSSGLGVLLFVSISFGLAFGVYETFLPLYWDSLDMDHKLMGVIFAAAAAGVFVLRIYAGRLSDVFGRKLFYTLSLGEASVAQFATPLLASSLVQALLKTSRDAAGMVRETMHSVLLYERSAKRFMGSLGITRGAEVTCLGLGSLIGGLLIWFGTSASPEPNFKVPFVFSAVLILIATVAFGRFFKAGRIPQADAQRVGSLRALFSADLPSKLWVLVAFGFVFETGLFATHCFVMQIYFKTILTEALHLNEVEMLLGVAVIMMLHRVTAGLPMMLVAPRLKKNFKGLFIALVICEGVAVTATPFIPNPWIAIAVWLTHDLVGAGVWVPIHNHYIQKYARPDSRGADVSKVLGLSQLGRVAGPLLAGVLFEVPMGYYAVGAPFAVGGIIMIMSSLILLKL